jgi:hypothetical protein
VESGHGTPFKDLASCVGDLVKHFPDDRVILIDGRPAPKFLFRGEPKCYQTTESSQVRLRSNSELTESDRREILKIVDFLARFLQDQFDSQSKTFGTPRSLAAHFMQHYGLPTPFIDFTANINTAAFFAADGEASEMGTVAVIRSAKAVQVGALYNLDMHPWAERARRQSAYAFAPLKFQNLKSDQAIKELGIIWFQFIRRETDREAFLLKQYPLLELGSDPVAGLLRFAMNCYVADLGKLNHPVAEWIANHIPTVQLTAAVLSRYASGLPNDIEFVQPDAHFDEQAEKERSIRLWSQNFSEILAPTYMQQGSRRTEGTYRFPAT